MIGFGQHLFSNAGSCLALLGKRWGRIKATWILECRIIRHFLFLCE
ncbi:hypothetical protein CEV32_4012 [Brucella rhizosphaerae]|uniref:Uncharacterized protein n=1 Tax=Brucella rhizosphaerae TaxID=571254 RepID=A0A256FQX1_9HYPH|nr:hypothetical protein CEV32_4012 [Brucella rhizosphaerae]